MQAYSAIGEVFITGKLRTSCHDLTARLIRENIQKCTTTTQAVVMYLT